MSAWMRRHRPIPCGAPLQWPVLRAVLVLCAAILFAPRAGAVDDGITDYVTVGPGAYIIDMGVTPQTVANGLKPYGLVYELVKNQSVPVDWVIRPGKSKDGVDFTDPNSGRSYRGGPFVVQGRNLTPGGLAAINNWRAQGVVVDGPTTGTLTGIPVYDQFEGLANVVLDLKNGSIAASIFSAAGVPFNLPRYDLPENLNNCDDFFAMPHADPTWATHGRLVDYLRRGGYVWAGCHAVSMLENIDDPDTPTLNPDMNFLSTTGLVPFGDHDDGTPPYLSVQPADPVMQYLGSPDAAMQNGSEQIFLPRAGGAWRPGAKVLISDPDQPDVPGQSSGPAATLVYGYAFDNPLNGKVMYEGGHNVFKGTAPENVAAARIFLNFWLLSMMAKSPDVELQALETTITEGGEGTFTANVNHSSGVTYAWSSTGGGTFSAPNAASTRFTPPEVSQDTTIYIRLVVTDSCGRTAYDSTELRIQNLPKADLAITKTDSADPVQAGESFSYTLSVRNLGTETATNVVVEDTLPAELIYENAGGDGWTCAFDPATRKLRCTRPSLAVNASVSSEIVLKVTAPATPVKVSNTATVSSDLPDLRPANNSATQGTAILDGIDVSIAKQGPAAPVHAGNAFDYSLSVRNIGALSATSVTVTDVLPPSLSFIAASGSGWDCVYRASDRTVTCFLPTLAGGATSTLALTVSASGTGGDSVANTASVSSPDFVDRNLANNSSTATITLAPPADLRVTKTGSSLASPSRDVWTVTVSNLGPGVATGITVTDVMSGRGLTTRYTDCAVTPSQGSLSPASPWNVATLTVGGSWNIASLGVGASATLDFVCLASNDRGTTNVASVTSTSYDNNPANNQASAFTSTKAPVNVDLAISKTADRNPAFVDDGNAATTGDQITYTLTVSNISTTGDAKDVITVRDTLPPGTRFLGYSTSGAQNFGGSCAESGGVVTCTTTSDINKGTSRTLTITVNAPRTAGNITNVAQVSAVMQDNQFDPIGNNTTSVTTGVVHPSTDIAVTKTADNAWPPLGAAAVFTITARNLGTAVATNVRVSDRLPAGLPYQFASPAQATQGSYDPATGLWYVGSLAPGAAATLRLTVNADAAATNTACVYALDQPDTNTANNCGSASLVPQYTDLRMTKVASTLTPNVNSNVTFTVTLHNDGPADVNGVSVTPVIVRDLLDSGFELVSVVPSIGSYDPGTGNWRIEQVLASGSSASLTMTAKVLRANEPLVNTATIIDSGLPDPGVDNDSASVTLVGQQSDIDLTKTVDRTTPDLGTDLTFTITAKNFGPSQATGVKVTDLLPAGLSFRSASATQGSYDAASGLWAVGTVNPGTQVVLTIVATNTVCGDLKNTARVTAVDQYDPQTENNTASVRVASCGAADLELTKTVDKSATFQGDTVVFTLRLRNDGPSPATNAVVTDVLPPGLTFRSAVASQGSYAPLNGAWVLGAPVVVGQEAILTITAEASEAGNLINSATADSASGQSDPDPSNNTGVALVTVRPAVDLSVTKTGPASANLGETVNYTLVAKNFGPSDVNGARLADTVPAQITGVSWSCVATGDADCDSSAAGTGATGTGNAISLSRLRIGSGSGNALTLSVTGTASQNGSFTNTVILSPPAGGLYFDTKTSNNSASVTTVVSTVRLSGRVFADTGTNGGTANDGRVNGDEAGLASVAIRLTDCASTILVSTVTGGDGRYALAIPDSIAPGSTLCVEQDNLTGHLSTGGSPGNTGGAYDRERDRTQFALTASSNFDGVDFGDVPPNRLLTDGVTSALPGTTVSYPHEFIAGSAGQVTFLANAVASPAAPEWTQLIYLDVNCDRELSAGADTLLSAPLTVQSNETVCLLLQQFVPEGLSSGASNLVTLQAQFVYDGATPALAASYQRQDLTTTGDAAVRLAKEVRNLTQASDWATRNTARSGDELEYRITYTNAGTEPISNLVVNDMTPAYTLFLQAQCVTPLPSSLNTCVISAAPAAGAGGPIRWTFSGTLAPALSGSVLYRVRCE